MRRIVPMLVLMMLPARLATAAAAPSPMSPEQAEAARQAVVAWFECDECEEGQLAAVVKYGEEMVPMLRGALLKGASPASQELLRRGLEARHDELLKYQETHPEVKVASSKAEFVQSNVDNLNAQYQVRAAQALAAIDGPAARRALDEGAKAVKREDVKRAVREAQAGRK